MDGGWCDGGEWNGSENGVIEVAKQERGEGVVVSWRAVMGDGKDEARVKRVLFIGRCR